MKVYDLLKELLTVSHSLKGRERQTLVSIVRVLEPVKNNEILLNIANRLEKEINIFEELRDILRFNRPDGKPILRQRPPCSTMKDVSQTEERLNKFYRQLQTRTTDNDPVIVNSSKKLINYLDKYSDKLVGHLVILHGRNQVIPDYRLK